MQRLIVALSLVVLVSGCARDHRSGMGAAESGSETVVGTASGTVSPAESSFAREACQAGVAEMEIGKLAARNTKNEAVRDLARKLVEDHSQAEKELAKIFARKGLQAEPQLAEHLQSSISHLATLKGREFDQAFKQQIISDHEKAVALYERQAEQGTDADLKAFAQKQLPQLREHLETARGLPISLDTKGPPPDASVPTTLQHPATRINIPR